MLTTKFDLIGHYLDSYIDDYARFFMHIQINVHKNIRLLCTYSFLS